MSKEKAKGTEGENRIVRWAKALGFPRARRILQAGPSMPDVTLFGDDYEFVIQVKRWDEPRLVPWYLAMRAQVVNVAARHGALVWIPKFARAEDYVWVLNGADMGALLQRAYLRGVSDGEG